MIGELDAEGNALLVAPYATQLRLTSLTLDDEVPGLRALVLAQKDYVLRHSRFDGRDGDYLTYLLPIPGTPGHVLFASVAFPDIRPATSYHLRTIGGTTISGVSERADGQMSLRTVASGSPMTLEVFAPAPAQGYGLAIGLLGAVAACGLLIAWLAHQTAFALNSLDEARASLGNAKTKIEEKAQTIAHDFRNRAIGLRGLKDDVRERLDGREMQRFDGLIDDINAYAEYLSLRLTVEALGLGDDAINSSVTYLRGAIDTACRQYFSDMRDVKIVHGPSIDGQEAFVAVPGADVSRILSNLLKNAVEAATTERPARVGMTLHKINEFVAVDVSDNGAGIPVDLQSRIFSHEVTTKAGPDRGHGLPSALDRAQRWGGSIKLMESGANGTTMRLLLPLAKAPSWFVDSIPLSPATVLVVVDDEMSAFEYWQKAVADRYKGIDGPDELRPTLIHVDSPQALKRNDQAALTTGTMFLVDQRFENDDQTGLQIIEELQLQERSVLVTNLFEQAAVIEDAARIGVKVLPKTYVLNSRFSIRNWG
ncbi:MAG: sensor histidine kinase [Acidobacteria bacterium]|nr:sensor histidine kinase [Acidobacteriota bacterium]